MPFCGGGHIFRYQLRDSELREATRGSGLMAGFRELSRKVADASALSQLVTWVLRGGYSGVTARAFRIGPLAAAKSSQPQTRARGRRQLLRLRGLVEKSLFLRRLLLREWSAFAFFESDNLVNLQVFENFPGAAGPEHLCAIYLFRIANPKM